MGWTDLTLFALTERRNSYDHSRILEPAYPGILSNDVSGRLYPNRDFSRNAEEDAAERPRAALERQPAFQHTPHCESGGEEMKIDNTAQEKRKKKKQQTQLE